MGLFGGSKKQSKDGKQKQSNLILSSEIDPSETFSISGCDMVDCPSGVFAKCKNLRKTTLNLSNNRLRDLGKKSDLAYLAGLTELDLSKNSFKTLPPEIEQLVLLRVLNISNNPKFGDTEIITKLTNLEELYIQGTLIKQCPDSWSNLTNLRQIKRDNNCKLPIGDENKISKCKINMDHDPSKDVYFDSCKLWVIPPDLFFKMRTLQKTYLNLSNNHLIELHNETNSLSDLAGIHHFDISNNCLGEIPDEINSLLFLTHLNISNNFIENLPFSLFQLTQLKSLNVDFNPICDVPEEITNLKSLDEFTCTSTNLEGLPECGSTKNFLLSLPCFLSDFSPSASTKSPISHLSSRDRSRKSSKVIDIFALNEEREKLQYLATEQTRMEAQAENVMAKQILEEEALKEKAAQIRAKEQNDQQNLVDLTLAQDAENRRFYHDLQRAKEEADLLSKEMLESYANKEHESIMDFLKQNQQEQQDFFKVTEEQMKEVDQEYLTNAMQHLFNEKNKFKRLYRQVQIDDAVTSKVIRDHLENETFNIPIITEDLDPKGLKEIEEMQKIAVRRLLEDQDEELLSIRNHALKVEEELLELTRLEQKKRQFEDEETAYWLEQRRLELSEMLGVFLKQEKEKELLAQELLNKMNEQREQDQAMFWLVQFQRLLAEKPVALLRLQGNLEPELAAVLQRSCVSDGVLEAISSHRITLAQLSSFSEEDFKRIGISKIGDITRLMNEIKKGPQSIASAPKQIEDGCSNPAAPSITVTVPSPVAPTAPPISEPKTETESEQIDENEECCICMDKRRSIVFLPCGHVCACSTCSKDLIDCPLCRVKIQQKILIYR